MRVRTMPIALAMLVAVAAPAAGLAAAPIFTTSRVVTAELKRQLGNPPTSPTARALMNRIVATTRARVAGQGDGGSSPTVRWKLAIRSSGGVTRASGSVTVRGLADDSRIGWTTSVTLRRLPAGTYDPVRWRLLRAERREICSRGVTGNRRLCV